MESSSSNANFDNVDKGSSIGVQLLAAAREGCGEEVIRILGEDPTLIHVTDPIGDTTVHVVARAGNPELFTQLVKFLQSHSEFIRRVLEEPNSHGDTPLFLARKNPLLRDTDAVRDLRRLFMPCVICVLSADIELDIVNSAIHEDSSAHDPVLQQCPDSKKTAWVDLQYEVQRSHEDFARQILEEDPSLIRYKMYGISLVHEAARVGHLGTLRLLLGFTTPDQLTSLMVDGNEYKAMSTPLHLALKAGHKDTAHYLVEMEPKAAYQLDREFVSPLHLAIEKGYEDLVRNIFRLMPPTAIAPQTLFQLQTKKPLAHAAITARSLSMLAMIREELPELMNVPDYKGWKPLSYAAYKGYVEGVCYSLEHFPESVKEYDIDGSLPIHKAVGGGHVSVVKALESHCPQTLYEVDRKGRSVLHFAVMCTQADVLKYLCGEAQLKSIFNLRDDQGKTFIDLANELKSKSTHTARHGADVAGPACNGEAHRRGAKRVLSRSRCHVSKCGWRDFFCF